MGDMHCLFSSSRTKAPFPCGACFRGSNATTSHPCLSPVRARAVWLIPLNTGHQRSICLYLIYAPPRRRDIEDLQGEGGLAAPLANLHEMRKHEGKHLSDVERVARGPPVAR